MTVTAEPLSGDRVEVVAFDLAETDEFALADPGRADGWRAFVRGTVAELTAAGIELAPARLVIEADVPRGAGLSSSAALEAALCLALLGVAGERERVPLAEVGGVRLDPLPAERLGRDCDAAVDRERQRQAAVVVRVLADQVHAAGAARDHAGHAPRRSRMTRPASGLSSISR